MSYQLARVQSSILDWPTGIVASFTAIAGRMVEHGPNFGLPHTRALGDGLFEIRAKGAEGIGSSPALD